MSKAYKVVLPIFALWLLGWIGISWAAIQDDALIHLRYADNLRLTHLIAYDGIHRDYGASSLLYVYVLAFLRNFSSSPNLPRAVSSLAHAGLFAGISFLILRYVPKAASLARLSGTALLLFLVVPSAVRWLDDGMETGVVLCVATLICGLTFRQTRCRTTPVSYLLSVVVGFVAVMLRTELALVCGLAWLILTWGQVEASNLDRIPSKGSPNWPPGWLNASLVSSHLLLGAVLALGCIVLKMHVLLPDTALAKSHGIEAWKGVLFSSIAVLAGALSFGFGTLLFWLLTLVLLLRTRLLSIPVAIANSVFPITVLLAALRGQEVQGARYLVWTLFFSILWNILTMSAPPQGRIAPDDPTGQRLIWALIAAVLLFQPMEAKWMFQVLTRRAETLAHFESQHLENLYDRTGIAFDVGYIGYFSHAPICDLAGLVNGRVAARKNNLDRAAACAANNPGFVFGNVSQMDLVNRFLPLDRWQVCGSYDFINLRETDRHYLLVPPKDAVSICRDTSGAYPYPARTILLPKPDR